MSDRQFSIPKSKIHSYFFSHFYFQIRMSKWIIPFSLNNQGDRIFSDWVISLKMDFYVFDPGILEFFLQHLRKVYFHITNHWAKGFQIFIQYKMFFLTPHSFLKPHLLTIFTSHCLPQSSGQWSFLFHAALACSCLPGPSPISDEYLLVFVFFLLYPMSSLVSPIFKTRLSSSPFSFLQGQLFHSSLGCPVHACFLVIDLLSGKTRLDPFVCFHVPLRWAGGEKHRMPCTEPPWRNSKRIIMGTMSTTFKPKLSDLFCGTRTC